MSAYVESTSALVCFLRAWVQGAYNGDNNLNFEHAVRRKINYNRDVDESCRIVEVQYKNHITRAHPGNGAVPGPPDDLFALRIPMPEEITLNNAVFCIDDEYTRIRDDAISYNHETEEITVYISDVTRLFNPYNEEHPNVERSLRRGKSSYGLEGLQGMFPNNIASAQLSLGSSKNNGEVLSTTFRLRENAFGADVELTALEARRVQQPIILTFQEVENMLLDTSEEECNEQCNLPTCNICLAIHLQTLYDQVLRFREYRFHIGLSHNCYRRFPTDNDNCHVSLSRYGRGRDTGKIRICMNRKQEIFMPCVDARRLVEECMVASNAALGSYCSNRNLRIIFRGRMGRGRASLEGLHNESNMVYRWTRAPRGALGVSAYVPWTNPIRCATDYLNHSIIHLIIRNRLGPIGHPVQGAAYDQLGIAAGIANLQHYLNMDILRFCQQVNCRAHVIAQLDKSIKDTAIYFYLANLCYLDSVKSPSKRRKLRIHATNMKMDQHTMEGSLYLQKYGCTIKNFSFVYPQHLQNNMENEIIERQALELTVVLEEVRVEEWFVRFRVLATN